MAILLVFAAGSNAARKHVAITPVTVVDVTDGSLHADQTVLVEGDRIAAVGPADEVAVPNAAAVVNGTGGYLIPGLWDMHAHAASEDRPDSFFRLFLAYGIHGTHRPTPRMGGR